MLYYIIKCIQAHGRTAASLLLRSVVHILHNTHTGVRIVVPRVQSARQRRSRMCIDILQAQDSVH